jgi:xanthine dehydrogenase accessory factor
MENIDVTVLRTLRDWRVQGKPALLATVVRSWGSSPRPVGSIMALCADGSVVGSVSGGCIEVDLRHQYANTLSAGVPTFVKYGVTADEAHRFGLPCGGTLELLLEYNLEPLALQALVELLEAGQLVRKTTTLNDGAVCFDKADAPSELMSSTTRVVNTFGPAFRMLLIGAGQLSEYLATMAIFSGFAVTVCDPREEYVGAWSVPGVVLVSDMPDDVVAAFKADRRTGIVALTHDPKLDDLALLEALQTEAFYIGAIGSRRNNAARHQRMIDYFDQTTQSLERLRGPIGIYIGSKTPPEIAVSVMAEILAIKNGVCLPREVDIATAKRFAQFLAIAGSPEGVPSNHAAQGELCSSPAQWV